MKLGSIDLKELEKFKNNLKKLGNKDSDEFMRQLTKTCAGVVLSKAINNTPVRTGDLRRGWTGGTETEPMTYIKSNKKVTKDGDTYKITLSNGVHYASYVEYGHTQEVGRYVPQIGKRLVNPWVHGQFMARNAVTSTKSQFITIGNKELERFLKEKLDV